MQSYKFVATLDSRTTTTCRSLDGKTFKLGQGPTPPVHINCRSTTVAVPAKQFQFLSEGRTRASKSGPVKANVTYYDWLKKQPKKFQEDALGKTRAKLFRDGGISAKRFGELQLDRNFQPLTLDELMKKEPIIFARAGVDI